MRIVQINLSKDSIGLLLGETSTTLETTTNDFSTEREFGENLNETTEEEHATSKYFDSGKNMSDMVCGCLLSFKHLVIFTLFKNIIFLSIRTVLIHRVNFFGRGHLPRHN